MELFSQDKIELDDTWITLNKYGKAGGENNLLLFPGVMSDAQSWGLVAQHINQWDSVSVVNRRGRFPSGPLKNDYSLQSEVDDLITILQTQENISTVFGWSYGGVAVLLAANEFPINHIIAYEPVVPPFGDSALSELKLAYEEKDWDRTATIVNHHISGFSLDYVHKLRENTEVWDFLKRMGEVLYPEIKALNAAIIPTRLATQSERIDLILGAENRDTPPYGTNFKEVLRKIPAAYIYELSNAGHLAHSESPVQLANLINEISHNN